MLNTAKQMHIFHAPTMVGVFGVSCFHVSKIRCVIHQRMIRLVGVAKEEILINAYITRNVTNLMISLSVPYKHHSFACSRSIRLKTCQRKKHANRRSVQTSSSLSSLSWHLHCECDVHATMTTNTTLHCAHDERRTTEVLTVVMVVVN